MTAPDVAGRLGGLLGGVEGEPETVTQLMAFVQREGRGGRHVNLDALGRLFGAKAVDEAARLGWLLDLGDGRRIGRGWRVARARWGAPCRSSRRLE